ncbi:MAG: hypothetical protein Q6364_11905 [Candidatus Hermodarchaeota archaeon]|nr:hypothetical protein [Candidatus Hermodarchaeota archaeon]
MTTTKEEKRSFDWDRVFGGIGSITFGLQLLSFLILLGAGIVFLLMLSGIWGYLVANEDIFIFVLLLAGGFAFLVFVWLLGIFLRFHRGVRKFIVGQGVGDIDADDSATKTILALFAISVLFVLVAGIYGYYLFWKYILDSWGVAWLASMGLTGVFFYEIGLLTVWIALGVIIITFIMQILTLAINRYAGRLVASVDSEAEHPGS